MGPRAEFEVAARSSEGLAPPIPPLTTPGEFHSPTSPSGRGFDPLTYQERLSAPKGGPAQSFLVETMGVEPTTSAMRVRRSPN